MKIKHRLLILLALLMSACSPAVTGALMLTPSIPAATASETPANPTTFPAITTQVGTALADESADQPAEATALPIPTSAASTLIPTLPSGVSPIELKYKLLSKFPDLFFCDPDYYPVTRGDEAALAQQRFPEMQEDAAGFQLILNHLGMKGPGAFSDEQKLLIYREHKKLDSIQFELAGNTYQFQLQTADKNKQGYIIQGEIDGNGVITVEQREPSLAACPN
jgi:hypothetical protein